jgi:hypothetical protein
LDLTDEDDPIDEISRVEARLGELAEITDRCRKFVMFSEVAIATGGALLLVSMLGLLRFDETATTGRLPQCWAESCRSDRMQYAARQWTPLAPPRRFVRI